MESGGTPLQVVNVHLAPFGPPKTTGLGDVMQWFGRVESVHAKEIERINGYLSDRMPVFVLGDFNSLANLAAPRFLIEKGFVDSFASVTESPEMHPTWNNLGGKMNVRLRVDYIFHSAEVSTTESRCIPTDASDHFLVVSRVTIPSK